MPRLTSELVATGVEHLRRNDRVLRRVIDRVGPFALRPRRDRFGMLVKSIVSQQISTAAAASIHRRLAALVSPDGIAPHVLAGLSETQLRGVGLSPQKTAYLRDLVEKVAGGAVRLDRIGRLDDEAVIAELVQVKGIGRWTAQMFLIFSLGRADVFPHDDLGIRSALRRLYGLPELPKKDAAVEIAANWRPFATIASWYCWRSGDIEKAETGPNGTPW